MIRIIIVAAALGLGAGSAWAATEKGNVTVDSSKLKWSEVVPGVTIAPVQGNPDKGASHFFLKYAAGLKTPLHHHSPDHYVTLVSGTLTMVIDGVEHKFTPGSFFALRNKSAHVAVCEGTTDCLMSIDARGKWDVVAEKN